MAEHATKDERVRAAIAAAVRRPSRHRRDPLEVTADRLAGHLMAHHNQLDGAQRDEFSHVIFMLEQLAEGVDPRGGFDG